MKLFVICLLAILGPLSVHAETPANSPLPIEPGMYVNEGTPCHNPAAADVYRYDGAEFGISHLTCQFREVVSVDTTYLVKLTCGLGDEQASDSIQVFKIEDRTHFKILGSDFSSSVERCGDLNFKLWDDSSDL